MFTFSFWLKTFHKLIWYFFLSSKSNVKLLRCKRKVVIKCIFVVSLKNATTETSHHFNSRRKNFRFEAYFPEHKPEVHYIFILAFRSIILQLTHNRKDFFFVILMK